MKTVAFSSRALIGAAMSGLVVSAMKHGGKPLGYGPLHTKPKPYKTIYRLNRSRKWAPASGYEHARSLAPTAKVEAG